MKNLSIKKIACWILLGSALCLTPLSGLFAASPSTPAISLVRSDSANTVYIEWGLVTDASGYKLERSLSSTGTYTPIATLNSNLKTTYLDTGLNPDTSYYYRLRAYNQLSEESEPSVAEYVTTLLEGPILSATTISTTQINLSWSDNYGDETGFDILQSSSDLGPFSIIAQVGPNITTYSNTALTNGKTYYYEVRANFTAGWSAWSNIVSAMATTPTTPPTITQQPASVTLQAGVTAQFSITATGSAPLTYQWMKNGIAITGATNASYTTPVISLSDNGSRFSCTVTNAAGSKTSNEAILTVVSATYTITAPTTISGGTISPSGIVTVNYLASQSFTIIPDANCTLSDVLINGTSVGPVTSYTFNSVTANHTISATFIANITNHPPVLAAITNQIVNENVPVAFTATATDIDGDTLKYSSSNLPTGATLDETTGQFNWTPNYSQTGNYTISISVSDGNGGTDTKDTNITVNNVNTAPVITKPTDKTIAEGSMLTFLVTATDAEGDALTYSATNLPNGATFDPVKRAFVWTPDYNSAGTYSVTFKATEAETAAQLSVEKTIKITVTATNRAPILPTIDDIFIAKGTSFNFDIPKATDLDIEDTEFTYTAEYMPSATQTPQALPKGAYFNPSTLNFSWDTSSTDPGNYLILFTVADKAGAVCSKLVTITIGNSASTLDNVTTTDITSSTLKIKWNSVTGASGYKIFIAPEPSLLDISSSRQLIGTVPAYTTSYTITKLAAACYVFVRIEAVGASTYKDTYAKTIGGQMTQLNTPLKEAHLYSPNILLLVMENKNVRSYNDKINWDDDGIEVVIGDTGAQWQQGPWSIARLNEQPIVINKVYRESRPAGQREYTLGYAVDSPGNIMDVNHYIYLQLAEPVGNNDILRIHGPLDTDIILPYSDYYLETPVIQLNQVGYSPRASKRYAYVSGWMGDGGALNLINFPNTADVLSENIGADAQRTRILNNIPVTDRAFDPIADPANYDKDSAVAVKEINLSTVPENDNVRYRIRIPGVGVSWPTMVSEYAVLKSFYVTSRGFYLNRWGRDLQPQWTDWSPRPPDHPFVYTAEKEEYTEKFPSTTPRTGIRTLVGGHHDAGDFDIRPFHHIVAMELLRTYERTPAAFLDAQLTIPESGNNIPDILDEILYNLAAWEQLQEADGGIRSGVESWRHPYGLYYADDEPADKMPYWTYSRNADHTARIGALFAKAARLVAPFDKNASERLRDRAIKAYNYAYDSGLRETNLGYMMYITGELYRLTQDELYKQRFEAAWPSWVKWNKSPVELSWHSYPDSLGALTEKLMVEDLMAYITDPNAPSTYVSGAINALTTRANTVADEVDTTHAFRHSRRGDGTSWGASVAVGRDLEDIYDRLLLTGLTAQQKQKYLDAISLSADYVLGCNPLGMVWITGLGTVSPTDPLHGDSLAFMKDKGMPPMPGIAIYGPSTRVESSSEQSKLIYPDSTTYPPLRMYFDCHYIVAQSEFTIWETQAPQTALFATLLSFNNSKLMPPVSWLPQHIDHKNSLPTPGVSENSQPSAPQNLTATVLPSNDVNLSWSLAQEPPSGIFEFKIYRDAKLRATTQELTYTDTGLTGSTAKHSYYVTVVSRSLLESNPSNIVTITTNLDTTGPRIESIISERIPTEIKIIFNEEVDKASAQDLTHYSVVAADSSTLALASATLLADNKTVLLITGSPQKPTTTYTLTVSDILDLATPKQNIGNDQKQYVFVWQPDYSEVLAVWTGETTKDQATKLYNTTLTTTDVFKGTTSLKISPPNASHPTGGFTIATAAYRSNIAYYDYLIFWIKASVTAGKDFILNVNSYNDGNTSLSITPYIIDGASTAEYRLAKIPIKSIVGDKTIYRPEGFAFSVTPFEIENIYIDDMWLVKEQLGVNYPPVIATIGNKEVYEGDTLAFFVTATDLNRDPLTFSANNLPEGASFDPATQFFSWTPTYAQSGVYYNINFTVADNNGATDSSTITIVVKDVARNIYADFTVNKTQGTVPLAVQFTDQSVGDISVWLWNFGDGTTSTEQSPAHTYTTPGAYTVRLNVTNTNDSDSVTKTNYVTVTSSNTAPVAASLSLDTNENVSKSLTLSATDAEGDSLTYIIIANPAHGTLSGQAPNLVYIPNTDYAGVDTFTYVANDNQVNSNIATVSITINHVNAPPVLDTIADKLATEGATISFTVNATDPDNDTITYTASNLPTGATFSNKTFSWTPEYTQVGDHTFSITATDGNGGSDTTNVKISVALAVPTISTQPLNQSVNEGLTATFSVTATGNGLSYQWQKNNVNISNATLASYTTPATVPADNNATFRCVVTNAAGSVTSNAATLTLTLKPVITVQPISQSINEGATATFSITATNSGLSYQWQKNNTDIAGANLATYTTPATVAADNGATFRCVVTNAAGSITSNNATLNLNFADRYITVSLGTGGSISPAPEAGKITVPYDGSKTLTIAANPGYIIQDVLINGISVGKVTSYTFNNVTADSTIQVAFASIYIEGENIFTEHFDNTTYIQSLQGVNLSSSKAIPDAAAVSGELVPDASCLALLHLNGNYQDASSYNRAVTTTKPPKEFSDGRFQGGMNFNGIWNNSSYLQIPDAADLKFPSPQDFAVSLWFRKSTPNTVREMLVIKRPSYAGFDINIENNLLTVVYADGKDASAWHSTNVNVSKYIDGNWHNLVVNFDRNSAKKITIYLDAVNLKEFNIAGYTGEITNTDPMRIGHCSPNGSFQYPYSGDLDEIAIYNRVLGTSEITAHFNSASTRSQVVSTPLGDGTAIYKVNKIEWVSSKSNFDVEVSTDGINWIRTTNGQPVDPLLLSLPKNSLRYRIVFYNRDDAGLDLVKLTWDTTADTVAPEISGLNATSGQTVANITFSSNERANATLRYKADGATDTISQASTWGTTHAFIIESLSIGKNYTYWIDIKDVYANGITYGPYTFTTKNISDAPIVDTGISNDIALENPMRIGITMQQNAYYGGNHLHNIIMPTPAFPKTRASMLSIAKAIGTGNSFVSKSNGGQITSDDFSGGKYYIGSGSRRGETGTITNADPTTGTITLSNSGTAIEKDTVFWLTGPLRPTTPNPPNHNWIGVWRSDFSSTNDHILEFDNTNYVDGQQSIKITVGTTGYIGRGCYLNDLLMPGKTYRFIVRAKASSDGAKLITNYRDFIAGEINQTLNLTTQWQEFSNDIKISSDPASHTITYCFKVNAANNKPGDIIWVDKVDIQPIDSSHPDAPHWPYHVVEQLKAQKLGVIRFYDMFGLGAHAESYIPDQYNRELSNFNNGNNGTSGVPLAAALELAKAIKAKPWLTIPIGSDPDSWRKVIDFLTAPADSKTYGADQRVAQGHPDPWVNDFDTIYLEVGNELWNGIFSPWCVGIGNAEDRNTGAIYADMIRCIFDSIEQSPYYLANTAKIKMIAGGWAANGGNFNYWIDKTVGGKIWGLSLAPYIINPLNNYSTKKEKYESLFADVDDFDKKEMSSIETMLNQIAQDNSRAPTNMCVYELNTHFTGPSVTSRAAASEVCPSIAAGVAVMEHSLRMMQNHKVQPINIFNYIQKSYDERVGLWGNVLNDKAHYPYMPRPIWNAMKMLNNYAIDGQMVKVNVSGSPTWDQPINGSVSAQTNLPYVTSYAFKSLDNAGSLQYNLVLFNRHITDYMQARVATPIAPQATVTRYTLWSQNITDNNEDIAGKKDETELKVKIATDQINDFGNGYTIALPPYSMTILQIKDTYVAVKHTIAAGADENGTINPSGNITVADAGNASFTISPNSGFEIKDVLVDGTSAGKIATYTFTNVTADHKIDASFTLSIPTISTQPLNQSVNEGLTATFSVTATGNGLSYQWQKNSVNISNATLASYTTPATVAADNGATFRCIVTNTAGSVTSNAATLTLTLKPVISTQPANQSINEGSTATFSVTATGNGLSYQWQKNNTDIAGASLATYTTPTTVAADNGATFRCVVTNAAGNVTSNNATLTLTLKPVISTQPANQTVNEGATATFSVTSTGSGLTYQWQKNSVNISNATLASYTTPATVPTDNGAKFKCIVSNVAGSITSNEATLTLTLKPVITVQPISQSINEGATATFSITATNSGLSYQWQKNNTDIAGANLATYTTPITVPADNGSTFRCVVTNAAGNVTSNNATLTLTLKPVITSQPLNQSINEGLTATFSVTATGSGLTYQWQKNSVNISNATLASYTTPATVPADNNAIFRCIVTNAAGSITSNAATLTLTLKPVISTQPANQTVNEGSTATFSITATGSGLSYQWQKNNVNISNATLASYTTPATVAADNNSKFKCIVSNVAGNITSNEATLNLNFADRYITVSLGTGGSISPAPEAGKITVPYDGSKTITINADTGYDIDLVRVDGKKQGNINSYTFTHITDNTHTIEATFKLKTYQFTTNITGKGTITPSSGTYKYGDIVTVTATADAGYEFAGWTGVDSSDKNVAQVTINSDKTISAAFKDIVAPVITITSPLDKALFNKSPVTVSGNIVEDGSGISTITINGKTIATTNKTFSDSVILAEGNNNLIAECTDKDGNKDSFSITATLDTIAPAITIAKPQNNTFINTATPALEYTTGDASTVNIYLDNKVIQPAATLPALSEGNHTLRIEAFDKANNKAVVESVFSVDTKPPTGTLTINNASGYTNNPEVALTISASDAVSGMNLMNIQEVKGKDIVSQTGWIGYKTNHTYKLSSGDGTKELIALFEDKAGNQTDILAKSGTPVAQATIILDTVAPAVPTVELASTYKLINGIPTTNASPIKLNGTKDADTSLIIDGIEKLPVANKSTTWNLSSILANEGNNTITVSSKDIAGNESKTQIIVAQKQKVAIKVISPTKQYLGANDLISGKSAAPQISVLYTVDNETAPRVANFAINEGKNTVRLDAEDELGNKGKLDLDIVLDTTAPTININAPQNNQTVTEQQLTLQGTVKDASSGIQSLKVNGKPVALSGNSFKTSLNLSAGINTINIEATDNSANTASTSLNVTYEPPAESTSQATISGFWQQTTSQPAVASSPTANDKELSKGGFDIKTPENNTETEFNRVPVVPATTINAEEALKTITLEEPKLKQVTPKKISTVVKQKPIEGLLKTADNATPKVPRIKVAQIKPVFLGSICTLELETEQEVALWRIERNQKLPFGTFIYGNHNLYRLWFSNNTTDLKITIISADGSKSEAIVSLSPENK